MAQTYKGVVELNVLRPGFDGAYNIGTVNIDAKNVTYILPYSGTPLDYSDKENHFKSSEAARGLVTIHTLTGDYLVTRRPKQSGQISPPIQELLTAAGVDLVKCRIREPFKEGYAEGNINTGTVEEVHGHLFNPWSTKATVTFANGEVIVDEPASSLRERMSHYGKAGAVKLSASYT